MAELSFLKRAAMRLLCWIVKNPQDSRTHPLNLALYHRCADGRAIAPFSHPQVRVGKHTYGLRRESFFAYHPDDRVDIGNFCSIADGVRFVFGGHRVDGVSTFPFRALCGDGLPHADALSKGPIEVGNDVWIGVNATILSGVCIGDGAIVAAGAVVTRNVPPYAIVGGVPARIIRSRLPAHQVEALLAIRWWDWPIEKIRASVDLFYSDVDAFIARHSPGNELR